jgi:hypothetical protein
MSVNVVVFDSNKKYYMLPMHNVMESIKSNSGCFRSLIKGNRSLMKGTVPAEQGTFLNTSPLPFEGFFRNSSAIHHGSCSTMGERLVAIGQ